MGAGQAALDAGQLDIWTRRAKSSLSARTWYEVECGSTDTQPV